MSWRYCWAFFLSTAPLSSLGRAAGRCHKSPWFINTVLQFVLLHLHKVHFSPAVNLPAHLERSHLFLLLLSITDQKICAIIFLIHSYIRGKVLLQICNNNLDFISNGLISASALFYAVCRLICFSGLSKTATKATELTN